MDRRHSPCSFEPDPDRQMGNCLFPIEPISIMLLPAMGLKYSQNVERGSVTYRGAPESRTCLGRGIGNGVAWLFASTLEGVEEPKPMSGFVGNCPSQVELGSEASARDGSEVCD
jgi:hypothetical protein